MRGSCCLMLLLSLALVLTACASLDATLDLHEDGSGTRTVLVLVDETSYNLAKTSGMGDPLAQIAAEAGRRGATVEPYSEFARQGLRITQTFDRLGDIPPLPPLDDVIATRQSDLLGAYYAVTVTVDTSQLAAMTKGMDQLPLSSLKLTYNVALPGQIRTHNAAVVAGNTLTWTLDPTAGDVQTLTATSEVPYDLTVPYVIAIATLVAILLAVVGGLALLSARQRRRDERPSTILSGCLGVAMGLTLLVCLALTLLTGYLALEGRIFPISPLEDTGFTPAPTASGAVLFLLAQPLGGALAFALLVALVGGGLAVLLVCVGLLALVLQRRGSRAAPLVTGCLGGLLGTGLVLCLALVLVGGYVTMAGPLSPPAPTAIVHAPSPTPTRRAPTPTRGVTHAPTPLPPATPAPSATPAPTSSSAGVAPTLTPWHVPTETPRPARTPGAPRPTPIISYPVQAPAHERAMIPSARRDFARLDDPAHYTIDVAIDPAASKLTGRAEVVYANNAPVGLAEIYFRLFVNAPHYGTGNMRIDRVTVDGQPTQFEVRETALQVALPASLAPEARTTLVIDYQVTVPRNSGGYGVVGYNGPVMNLAHWYPILAVYDEEGWHVEPTSTTGDPVYSQVGLYDVRVTAPKAFSIVTSGLLVDEKDNADGTITWTYVSGPMRDFAIAASDQYATREKRVGDTVVRAYYLPDDEADALRMLDAAAGTLECHNQRFGEYPYVELDVCEVNLAGGAAGVEFPGLIFIDRGIFLGEADILYLLEFVVAHEVGHEWWYGVVGNDQVNHPWLDEGLANYSATFYFEHTMDKSASEEQLALWMALPYASYLMANPDQAVDQPASAFPDDEAYSAIVYGKGGLFFWKLRQVLGDEGYFKAMRIYYDRHKYGVAHNDDLLRAIEDATGKDVTDIYESWIVVPNGLSASDKAVIDELVLKVIDLAFRAGRQGRQ